MATSTSLGIWLDLSRASLTNLEYLSLVSLASRQMRFQVGDAVSFLWDTTFDLWHAAGEALSILWANLT
jgi:hypothetical protein